MCSIKYQFFKFSLAATASVFIASPAICQTQINGNPDDQSNIETSLKSYQSDVFRQTIPKIKMNTIKGNSKTIAETYVLNLNAYLDRFEASFLESRLIKPGSIPSMFAVFKDRIKNPSEQKFINDSNFIMSDLFQPLEKHFFEIEKIAFIFDFGGPAELQRIKQLQHIDKSIETKLQKIEELQKISAEEFILRDKAELEMKQLKQIVSSNKIMAFFQKHILFVLVFSSLSALINLAFLLKIINL